MRSYLLPLTMMFLLVMSTRKNKTDHIITGFRPTHNTVWPNAISKADTILFPGESHFANVRQLTFGGDNAEAYFSFDGKYIIFQKTNTKEGIACDQIWMG